MQKREHDIETPGIFDIKRITETSDINNDRGAVICILKGQIKIDGNVISETGFYFCPKRFAISLKALSGSEIYLINFDQIFFQSCMRQGFPVEFHNAFTLLKPMAVKFDGTERILNQIRFFFSEIEFEVNTKKPDYRIIVIHRMIELFLHLKREKLREEPLKLIPLAEPSGSARSIADVPKYIREHYMDECSLYS